MAQNMEAVALALERFGDSMMRTAYTYTHNMDDAQDVVQDVLLAYMTKAPTFMTTEHEKAWLIRVTINNCKNRLASSYRKTYAELDENISVCDTYESELTSVVNSLPEKYRTVIHLFYYEGYSQKEIAGIIGRTESAVATRLSRGREMLKSMLGDEYFD